MTPQIRNLCLALKNITQAIDPSIDDTQAGRLSGACPTIALTPEIISELQNARMLVRKYEDTPQ